MKKILFSATLGVVVIFLLTSISVASAASSNAPAVANARSATSTKNAIKGAIKNCAIIESKIQAKVTAFDNSKLKHLSVYANLKDRLTKAADRLAVRGADVSALRADLLVLDQKVAKFTTDYAAYMAIFKIGQDAVCGQPEKTFKARIKEAKTALQLVHKDAADIRSFVGTTIKNDLKSIKDYLSGGNASTTSTTTPARTNPTKPLPKPIVPTLPSLD